MEPPKKRNFLIPKENNSYVIYILYFLKNDIGFIMLLNRNSDMMKKMIFEIYFKLGIFNNF